MTAGSRWQQVRDLFEAAIDEPPAGRDAWLRGRGADSVVEAAGNPATWKQALAMVRRGGVVNFFSGLPSGTRVEIEPAAIHYSEIKLISPFHHTPRFIREALEAIRRGDILAHDFVTEEIRLADLPHAFEKMKSRSGEIKLAVGP